MVGVVVVFAVAVAVAVGAAVVVAVVVAIGAVVGVVVAVAVAVVVVVTPTARQVAILRANFSRVTVWRWLTGRRRPSVATALRIYVLARIPVSHWGRS